MIDSFRGKYRFLSNFYESPIKLGSLVFPTAEHAFQAMKCTTWDETKKFAEIVTPMDAKLAGQKVNLRSNWDTVKTDVMKNILWIKFQDESLRKKLLATTPEELVEGNTWGDTFWGICDGVGENHLGRLLMEVRNELETV